MLRVVVYKGLEAIALTDEELMLIRNLIDEVVTELNESDGDPDGDEEAQAVLDLAIDLKDKLTE